MKPRQRMNMGQVEPESYQVLRQLSQYVLHQTTISTTLRDLIYVRTSQLNGCAYCIQSHSREAVSHGENLYRLLALDAWREAPYFTEEERAVLALTEEVTLIAGKGVKDVTYNDGIQCFGEIGTAQLIMTIVTMNAWNRIGIATRLTPASLAEQPVTSPA